MDEEALAEAIEQVPEVVAMAKEKGGQQPQLRVMASEFFAGLSDSEKGRRALHEHGATKVCVHMKMRSCRRAYAEPIICCIGLPLLGWRSHQRFGQRSGHAREPECRPP